jgi:hypothetical protein
VPTWAVCGRHSLAHGSERKGAVSVKAAGGGSFQETFPEHIFTEIRFTKKFKYLSKLWKTFWVFGYSVWVRTDLIPQTIMLDCRSRAP